MSLNIKLRGVHKHRSSLEEACALHRKYEAALTHLSGLISCSELHHFLHNLRALKSLRMKLLAHSDSRLQVRINLIRLRSSEQ